jgi:hypothetical protein
MWYNQKGEKQMDFEAQLSDPDNVVVGQATLVMRAATGCDTSQAILDLFERNLVLISSLDGEPFVKLTELGIEVAQACGDLFSNGEDY